MKRLLLVCKLIQPSRVVVVTENHSSVPYSIFRPLFILYVVLASLNLSAQSTDQQQAEYKKVIRERVSKIITPLNITDSVKFNKLLIIISEQYYFLNDLYEKDKVTVGEIKKQSLAEEAQKEELAKQETRKTSLLKQHHSAFIAQLKDELTDTQVEKVKDGMTYSILPVTWGAYLDMLPALTSEQKDKMYGWLVEARELAMDEGSSDRKHAVFGKYKGRINNYLSAAGYDMKKEGEAWQKRIKEREAKKKESNG